MNETQQAAMDIVRNALDPAKNPGVHQTFEMGEDEYAICQPGMLGFAEKAVKLLSTGMQPTADILAQCVFIALQSHNQVLTREMDDVDFSMIEPEIKGAQSGRIRCGEPMSAGRSTLAC